MISFEEIISKSFPEGLHSCDISILQVNIGRQCNLSCAHCHLECSPSRTEMMSKDTMTKVITLTADLNTVLVDITGGAPELHAEFRWFIEELHKAGMDIQVRTNLAQLTENDDEDIFTFLHDQNVKLVGSLPCYLEENVDAQRGDGTYQKSINAIEQLNKVGYGTDGGQQLNLVYNPSGAFLPGSQEELEQAYKAELHERFGIKFSNLIAITNMPIGRFRKKLAQENEEDTYMTLLAEAYNPSTLDSLMCKHQVCVDWDGSLYDCDFNLAIGLTMAHDAPVSIDDFDAELLRKRKISTDKHCYGCTAGSGSSCAGSLTS